MPGVNTGTWERPRSLLVEKKSSKNSCGGISSMIKFAISEAIVVCNGMRNFWLVVKGHNVELVVLIGVDCGSCRKFPKSIIMHHNTSQQAAQLPPAVTSCDALQQTSKKSKKFILHYPHSEINYAKCMKLWYKNFLTHFSQQKFCAVD